MDLKSPQYMDDNYVYDINKKLREFWPKQRSKIRQMPMSSLRVANGQQKKEPQGLPLARIKKIMKIDDDVKSQMISAEAPVLLSKAAELIIEELTLRSWVYTQENRRKTIQKSDIAMAVSHCEMFDFLIDIVPRDEILKSRQSNNIDESEEFYTQNTDYAAPQVQYIVQYGNGDKPQAPLSNSVMQLENGQIIQATQIGPSIPLSSNPGEPIQVMTMAAGEKFQFVPVNGNGTLPTTSLSSDLNVSTSSMS